MKIRTCLYTISFSVVSADITVQYHFYLHNSLKLLETIVVKIINRLTVHIDNKFMMND